MNQEDISKLAFLLYPHIVTKGGAVSVESLAERIKQLQSGLLPEDEFAATVCWLGNCAGIYRIDQTPMPIPDLTEHMRAPDFVAFPIVNDRPFPLLIEVKSSHHWKIKWSEKYRQSLINFADHLKLPLLVAWKCGNLWCLVDQRHFERSVTGYRITMEQAFREDLSCLLFRNLRIQMNPDLEFILDMEMLDELAGDAGTLLPEGELRMRIKHAGFFYLGNEVEDKEAIGFSLFLAAPSDSEFRRTGKQTCQEVIRPMDNHGFSLSTVLVSQLSLGRSDEFVDWHRVLTEPLPSSGRQLRRSLKHAIDQHFVRYVLDTIPNTWPDFLPGETEFLKNNRD